VVSTFPCANTFKEGHGIPDAEKLKKLGIWIVENEYGMGYGLVAGGGKKKLEVCEIKTVRVRGTHDGEKRTGSREREPWASPLGYTKSKTTKGVNLVHDNSLVLWGQGGRVKRALEKPFARRIDQTSLCA